LEIAIDADVAKESAGSCGPEARIYAAKHGPRAKKPHCLCGPWGFFFLIFLVSQVGISTLL
jgi:hypothetical protein